ncbi:helix-turn-helix domain-containing protein [Bacillus sp. MUM 116]|uniref:PucR family transcriptional regulator n=1 Tax=Bacillus sp. MUM 116 TaxID=1678002 RepID=UPI00114D3EA1|nr:helix-turn-helix domain-containing protein [Bacillus sp. MUM 116]
MTLFIYLNENRSRQITSNKLYIHKQTLVYRISKIEQLTGRRLNVTKSVAELWFAPQTAVMLGLIPDFSEDWVEVN